MLRGRDHRIAFSLFHFCRLHLSSWEIKTRRENSNNHHWRRRLHHQSAHVETEKIVKKNMYVSIFVCRNSIVPMQCVVFASCHKYIINDIGLFIRRFTIYSITWRLCSLHKNFSCFRKCKMRHAILVYILFFWFYWCTSSITMHRMAWRHGFNRVYLNLNENCVLFQQNRNTLLFKLFDEEFFRRSCSTSEQTLRSM